MVGLWYYNQSGVTELLIMRDPHYGRMCLKSVKTLGTSLAVEQIKIVEHLGLYAIHNSHNIAQEAREKPFRLYIYGHLDQSDAYDIS